MSQSLIKLEISSNAIFKLKPSGIQQYVSKVCLLLCMLCLIFLMQQEPLLLVVTSFAAIFLLVRNGKSKRIIQLQRRSKGYWKITWFDGKSHLVKESHKAFKCTYFCLMYFRVVSTQKNLSILVLKDSIPSKKFQLLLYLLN